MVIYEFISSIIITITFLLIIKDSITLRHTLFYFWLGFFYYWISSLLYFKLHEYFN